MPFIKGQSGNPKGRPKGSRCKAKLQNISLINLVRQGLATAPENEKRTYAELIVNSILEKARQGEDRAQQMIFNYIEGAPRQISEPVNDENIPFMILLERAVKKLGAENSQATIDK